MAYYDFREYLKRLEENGELSRVEKEVDANLEVGAIMQRAAEKGGRTAHFTNVKGASEGATLVGGSMNRGVKDLWTKAAIALECDPEIKYQDLIEEVVRRLEAPVKPLQVKGGVCKENIRTGDEINLEDILAPVIHAGDAGKCISSWGFTVVKEPGSDYVMWDIIPHIIKSSSTLLGEIPLESPIGKVFQEKYEANNEAMPFAIVVGAVPSTTMAAAFRLKRGSAGITDVAGALQRTPLQLVKCESNDLMVPANCEMVIEGVVRPGEREEIDSFPSQFGYRERSKTACTLWDVHTVTYRNTPVLPFSTWGVPVTEIQLSRSLDCDTQIKMEFIKRGTPARDVYTPPWLAGSVVAISTKVPYTAFSQSVAGLVRSTEAGKEIPYILICDDDIDICQSIPLFHALVTKCHPHRDAWKIENVNASNKAPYLTAEERRNHKGAAMIFDCTWPLDWDRSIAVPPRVSFDQCYPEPLQQQVLEEWSSVLGFPKESDRPVTAV
jgi:UbiD family decarboxylase